MGMSKQKTKGGLFTRSLLPLLRKYDPTTTELVQAGKNDKGDAGGYYLPFGVEAKNYTNYGGQLAGWLDEAKRESIHAGKPVVVVFKRRGTTAPERQFVVTELGTFLELVKDATPALTRTAQGPEGEPKQAPEA